MRKELIGEAVGTFILVFIGCSAIILAEVFGILTSLYQVALVWGIGVSLAIYAIKSICPAHLNPAVSFAMLLTGNLKWTKFIPYSLAQLAGAFLAGATVFLFFNGAITGHEELNEITRGLAESRHTAMFFGEFFPNPSFEESLTVNYWQAFFIEAFGTLILVFSIFRLTHKAEELNIPTILLIGLTVTLIICLIAPYTQAGINPARDFGPRFFASIAGWNSAAFAGSALQSIFVYVAGPFLGSAFASLLHKIIHR